MLEFIRKKFRAALAQLGKGGLNSMNGYTFVSVEFPDDPAVKGNTYWYLCEFPEADIGVGVIAPLGSHNRLSEGVIRRVMFAEKKYAPYPLDKIKRIQAIRAVGI